jgi:ATP-dependent Clp protease ATP-binding subunit ClpA
LGPDPNTRPKAKAAEDDEDEDDDGPQTVLVDAAPRKALPSPKERKERPPKTSGTVPNVPRRKDE